VARWSGSAIQRCRPPVSTQLSPCPPAGRAGQASSVSFRAMGAVPVCVAQFSYTTAQSFNLKVRSACLGALTLNQDRHHVRRPNFTNINAAPPHCNSCCVFKSRARMRRLREKLNVVAEFQSSGVMNDRERPRILLWATPGAQAKLDWVERKAGTFCRIRMLEEVDLGEWDVIVTDKPHAQFGTNQYGVPQPWVWSRVPNHLYVFRIFSPTAGGPGRSHFEFNIDENNHAELARSLALEANIPGHQMHRIAGLPEPLQDLVKSSLLPAVEARSRQFGIVAAGDALEPAIVNFRPFLLGPSELIMAASLERPGGGSIWLVPDDLEQLETWFDVASTEWHTRDRQTFPNVTTWQTNSEWETAAERTAHEKLAALDDGFANLRADYESARVAAVQELDQANTSALLGPKALLTAQDQQLQDAVLVALTQLGFEVEDMDHTWSDRERREDFRISDADAPGWLVIADATGVAKGAPGSKIATVLGYLTKYVLEVKPSELPGIWIIVNRLFHRDPMTRGDIYRADDLAVLTSQNGLAIDSAALFLLTQAVESDSDRARSCRTWLRRTIGQVSTEDARSWLASNP
jgi:hypothetical protein